MRVYPPTHRPEGTAGPRTWAIASGVGRGEQGAHKWLEQERITPAGGEGPLGGWRWKMPEPRMQVPQGAGTFGEVSIWLGCQTCEGESRQARKDDYSWVNPLGSQ